MAKESTQNAPPRHPTRRRFVGLSLEKFAAAKNSTYDKQRRKEREDNLRAGKINKYRKLKAKLQRAGELHGTNYSAEANINDDLELEAGAHPRVSPSEPSEEHQDASARERESAGASGRGEAVRDEEGSSGAVEGLAAPSRGKSGERNQKKRKPEAEGKASGKKQRTKPTQVERLAAKAKAEKDAIERARDEARQAREKRQAQIAAVEKQRKAESKLFRQKTSRGQPVMKHRINKLLEILEKA